MNILYIEYGQSQIKNFSAVFFLMRPLPPFTLSSWLRSIIVYMLFYICRELARNMSLIILDFNF